MTLQILYLDQKNPAKPDVFKLISEEFSDEFELIQASLLSSEEFEEILSECEFLIATTGVVPADLIKRTNRLKMIHKWGAGYDTIDVESARSRGILVARTTGSNTVAVAEHTVMLILALYRQLVDTVTELKSMKKSATIINTSRGKVVDEKALYQALKNGDIAGAGLDVFDKEPVASDNPLLKLPNVVVTPHVAPHTRDTLKYTANRVYQNIKRVADGLDIDEQYLVKH